MATTTDVRQSQQTRVDSGSPDSSAGPQGPGIAGRVLRGGLLVLVIAGLIVAAAYGSTRLLKTLADEDAQSALTHRVQRDELLITVTEDGNVESASNLDIKCQVAGGSSILWIVPDGEQVQEGDKLVELDQATLEEQISQQKITYEKVRAVVIQAEKDYEVAQIAVQEYLEGTLKKEAQDADAQITIAEENLRTAKNALDHSERMFRRGYISNLELEGQQFSVQRAQLELDSANTAKEVLVKFTKVKTLEDLRSQVETAKARMDSEKAAFELEEARLKRLEEQIKNCVIYAPQGGMVVYANDASRSRFGGSQQAMIEEGAQVRERQNLLRLPDLAQMQVKVNVHETKVESLSRGMRARVQIQDKQYQGTVVSIANQPESTSWFSGNVKEYGTIARIEGETEGLKPGMTAEVEILVAHLQDVLTLPIAAVVEQRGEYFCWVKQGDSTQRRPLLLGMSNDQFVEVKDGVREGEEVLLNPRAVVEEARGGDDEVEQVDVEQRFGTSKATEDTGAAGPAAGDAQGAGPGAGSGGEPARGDGGGGAGGGMDFTQFDTNGDGNLSKEEAPEFMQSFFDRVDSNTDGVLDAEELRNMRNRAGSGQGGRGGGANLMQYDADGDGKVTREEAPEFMQRMFERADENGDGAIDQSEIEAMRSRFGGGGGGPGGGRGGGPAGGPGGRGSF